MFGEFQIDMCWTKNFQNVRILKYTKKSSLSNNQNKFSVNLFLTSRYQKTPPLHLDCQFFDPNTDIVMYLMADSVSSQIFWPLIPVLVAKLSLDLLCSKASKMEIKLPRRIQGLMPKTSLSEHKCKYNEKQRRS